MARDEFVVNGRGLSGATLGAAGVVDAVQSVMLKAASSLLGEWSEGKAPSESRGVVVAGSLGGEEEETEEEDGSGRGSLQTSGAWFEASLGLVRAACRTESGAVSLAVVRAALAAAAGAIRQLCCRRLCAEHHRVSRSAR